MSRRDRQPKIGDIYLMDFSGRESEQRGWRPGLVFQNNVGNTFSPNIIALPLTSSIKKISQPTHVLISASETGVARDSIVLCENPQRMSKERLGNYITTVSDECMAKIAEANLFASCSIAFIDPDKLLKIREKAAALNSKAI